jgi:hypothetical protein
MGSALATAEGLESRTTGVLAARKTGGNMRIDLTLIADVVPLARWVFTSAI